MNVTLRVTIFLLLLGSIAWAATKIDPAPYRLYVQSIEPSLGLDLYGRERVPVTLSNGTSWVVTQFLYWGWGARSPLLPRGALGELIPIGDAVRIHASLEQERYEWSLEFAGLRQVQAELTGGKENLPTIIAHEEVASQCGRKTCDLWKLSDGSLWGSGETTSRGRDCYASRRAWQVGDHVIVSFRETDMDGELLDTPRFWMLNTDYDWYTPAHGGQKYKPFIFVVPLELVN